MTTYRREHVWISAWCSVAGALGVKEPHTATAWADKCLKAFDERFPTTEKEKK